MFVPTATSRLRLVLRYLLQLKEEIQRNTRWDKFYNNFRSLAIEAQNPEPYIYEPIDSINEEFNSGNINLIEAVSVLESIIRSQLPFA